MKIPERGPSITDIMRSCSEIPLDEESIQYASRYNGRYLHWSELEYRDLGQSSRECVWALMKMMRLSTYEDVRFGDVVMHYNLPGALQKMLHEIDVDMHMDSLLSNAPDDRNRMMFAISSAMEESIASSQLEGASTTTRLAKKLLRSEYAPRDISQQMIVNNYRAMQFIKEHAYDSLSPELIRSIHRIIAYRTLDDESHEGMFRNDDSIAVRNPYEDITYYEPVDHQAIGPMIESLCVYANDDSVYVHPIVKGIILHFAIAYIHPFVDGNGRVARALFYWYAMKNGYSMVEFLSISRVIKNHRQKYDEAYLKAETDDNDLTYFIQYNLGIITESIGIFSDYVRRKLSEQKDAQDDLKDRGLNLRQSEMLRDMVRSGDPVSVYELASRYQATQTTVRRDLLKMVDLGLVELCGKDGYRQLYRSSGKK